MLLNRVRPAPSAGHFRSNRPAPFQPSRPQQRVHRKVQWQHASNVQAASTAETYAQQISAAEQSSDWVRAFEVLTEANVLKVELPADTQESAIRTMAQGGQWQRSLDMLRKLTEGGHKPQAGTITAVFDSLGAAKQAEPAQALLKELSAQGMEPHLLGPAQNLVIRVVARGGRATEAFDMLEAVVTAQKMVVEPETYAAVCNELIKAGEAEKAEEVLEWRDFLALDFS